MVNWSLHPIRPQNFQLDPITDFTREFIAFRPTIFAAELLCFNIYTEEIIFEKEKEVNIIRFLSSFICIYFCKKTLGFCFFLSVVLNTALINTLIL